MSNTELLITPQGTLVHDDMLNGSAVESTIQFIAMTDETGSVLHMFNKFDACLTFDNKKTVTVNLTFSGANSQVISIKELGPDLFNTVDIYVDLIDDTTADGDLYEHLVTNTLTLSLSGGKTLADYVITDAYTKDEVDAKISGKADKSYVDGLVGDIESRLAEV